MAKRTIKFEIEEKTICAVLKEHDVSEMDLSLLKKWLSEYNPVTIDLNRIMKIIDSDEKVYVHAILALLSAQLGLNYMKESNSKMN